MIMKVILLFLGLIIGMSCNRSKIPSSQIMLSEDCQEYLTFIKSQWTKSDHLFLFRNDPEYWKDYNKYNQPDCIKGKSITDIKSVFGDPTKQFIFPESTIWVYCMNEACQEVFLDYKNKKELVIIFGESERVKSIYFNPTFQIQD